MKMNKVWMVVCGLCWVGVASGAGPATMPWDLESLRQTPKMYDAPTYYTNQVKACFYESVPYTGVTTRVFAYYGFPSNAIGRVPAMVLIHGGGGSAFYKWVELWNQRGYAAIAMDTCGAISNHGYRNHPRSPWGGPEGWGGYTQLNRPLTDQWTYHAVAAVIKGHSLLRSFPQVDPEKIGVTGISWGGYLTCIVAPLDDRFKFAVPVYGCGYIYECPLYGVRKPEDQKIWNTHWDPSLYLPLAKMPFLWVTGSNDFAFPFSALQKSYRLLNVPSTLCIRLRMPHGHNGPGENPAEILAFAEHVLHQAPALPTVSAPTLAGTVASIRVTTSAPFTAQLNYTTNSGVWKARDWKAVPAEVRNAEVRATLPANTTTFYFNVVTTNDMVVSSEHMERL